MYFVLLWRNIGCVIVKQFLLTYYGPIFVEVLWTKYDFTGNMVAFAIGNMYVFAKNISNKSNKIILIAIEFINRHTINTNILNYLEQYFS